MSVYMSIRKKPKFFEKQNKKAYMAHTYIFCVCAICKQKASTFFLFHFCYIRVHVSVFILWLRKLHFLFWSIDNNAIVIVDVRAISFRTMLMYTYMNEEKKIDVVRAKTQK